MSEYGDISPDLKQQYAAYSSRLAEALHALDLANARYQRAAHVSIYKRLQYYYNNYTEP